MSPPRRVCKNEKEHPIEYKAWKNMRSRCNSKSYYERRNYQKKGIKVCERWNSFENFFADMGERPNGCSLDRINNDGDYCPGNCRWTDNRTQSRNKDVLAYYTHDGRTQCLTAWAEEYGVSRKTLIQRRADHPDYTLEQLLALKDWRNKPIIWRGREYTKNELMAKYNLKRNTFDGRIKRGWSFEKALLTPTQKQKKKWQKQY